MTDKRQECRIKRHFLMAKKTPPKRGPNSSIKWASYSNHFANSILVHKAAGLSVQNSRSLQSGSTQVKYPVTTAYIDPKLVTGTAKLKLNSTDFNSTTPSSSNTPSWYSVTWRISNLADPVPSCCSEPAVRGRLCSKRVPRNLVVNPTPNCCGLTSDFCSTLIDWNTRVFVPLGNLTVLNESARQPF